MGRIGGGNNQPHPPGCPPARQLGRGGHQVPAPPPAARICTPKLQADTRPCCPLARVPISDLGASPGQGRRVPPGSTSREAPHAYRSQPPAAPPWRRTTPLAPRTGPTAPLAAKRTRRRSASSVKRRTSSNAGAGGGQGRPGRRGRGQRCGGPGGAAGAGGGGRGRGGGALGGHAPPPPPSSPHTSRNARRPSPPGLQATSRGGQEAAAAGRQGAKGAGPARQAALPATLAARCSPLAWSTMRAASARQRWWAPQRCMPAA